MGNLNKFNANDYPPETQVKGSYDPLPKGKYTVCIVSSETNPTKKGDGEFLSLKLEVLDGDFKGRKLFETLLLDHPSEKAVEIAKKKLAQICRAVNVLTPDESDELHDKPFVADVGVRKNNYSGKDENVIWTYLSCSDSTTKKTTPLKRKPLSVSLPKQVDSEGDTLPPMDDEIPF